MKLFNYNAQNTFIYNDNNQVSFVLFKTSSVFPPPFNGVETKGLVSVTLLPYTYPMSN